MQTLYQLGAITRESAGAPSEFWRFLSAPLLHLSPPHLLYNCVALLVISYALEPAIGRRWTAAIFAIGALAGGAASALMLPQGTLSVGASGGILALYSAGFIVLWRLVKSELESELGGTLFAATLTGLVPALLPLGGLIGHGPPVDFGAHLGGLSAGVLLGLLILRSWGPHLPQPLARLYLTIPAAAGLVLATGALVWRIIMVAF